MRHPAILHMATSAIVYCCRLLRGTNEDGTKNMDNAQWGLLPASTLKALVSDDLLMNYLTKKSTHISEEFMASLLTRAPLAMSVMVSV